jgi:hypothetical protein
LRLTLGVGLDVDGVEVGVMLGADVGADVGVREVGGLVGSVPFS